MTDTSIAKVENLSYLDEKSEEIVKTIIDENDPNNLKNLVSLFNSNQSKKDIVRNNIFSIIMDKISLQMLERFEKNPNAFSNKDLIDYLSAIKNAKKNTDDCDFYSSPTIQNNTQINFNVGNDMSRESREKVASAVKSILSRLNGEKLEYVDEEEVV